MADESNWYAWEMRSGTPISVGDAKLTPESRTLTLRWARGGFVWNHPTAMVVERNGVTQRVAIPDVTLMAVLSLAGLAALGGLVLFLFSPRQRKATNEQRN